MFMILNLGRKKGGKDRRHFTGGWGKERQNPGARRGDSAHANFTVMRLTQKV